MRAQRGRDARTAGNLKDRRRAFEELPDRLGQGVRAVEQQHASPSEQIDTDQPELEPCGIDGGLA